MAEMKIGEVMAFKCVETDRLDCVGCMCNREDGCDTNFLNIELCESSARQDKKNVIFVRTTPNEIIRKRIEESIDEWSGGDDDRLLRAWTNGGDCNIGLKASYWKTLLLEILQVEDEE